MVAELLELPLTMDQELNRVKMRARRIELGLSQAAASEAASFTGGAAQWSDIENGRKVNVTMTTLVRIATALQLDARDLITDPPAAKPKRGRA